MAMRQQDQDEIAVKMAELAARLKEMREITTVLQKTVDRNVETYTWIAGRLGAAQVHFKAGEANIEEGRAAPPPK